MLVRSLVARSLATILATVTAAPQIAAAGVHGFDVPATDQAQARDLLRVGLDALHAGDHETAIQKLEEAHALGRDPVVLFHLGRAYTRRFDTDDDLLHLRKARVVFLGYLESAGPDAPLTSAVHKQLGEVEARIAAGEATVLFLADIPDQVQLYTIDGKFKMGFRDSAGREVVLRTVDAQGT